MSGALILAGLAVCLAVAAWAVNRNVRVGWVLAWCVLAGALTGLAWRGA